MAGDVVVERVAANVVLPLRSAVLRPGLPLDAARLDVDDLSDTATFAAIERPDARTSGETGTVVGTALVYPVACPWVPEARGWRLRGMATAPGRRSAGIGARVVQVVVDHVESHGGEVLWCFARVPARRFYERAGFVAVGDEWDEPGIGPHVSMGRDLRGAPFAEP
jgi:GNAT superfamily N-acetyltransferase